MSNRNYLVFVKSCLYTTVKTLSNYKNYIGVTHRCIMDGPKVETKQGTLRGAIRDNIDGGQYFSFRGIPFAEPPVGKLRFKDPQPLQSWTGIRDALEESKMSAQLDIFSSNEIIGGDDCLYLDVATNSLTGNRPVMVWIHGGAFQHSSNTYKKYGPDYLLKKDIVFVSTNYRLGILGFLNMEHEECSGNQGLKDQIEALKWVQNNIEQFGGDPNNVTIFGESAGGSAVHALCVSPLAKGYFHKAIMQSGVLFNPWAFTSTNKNTGYIIAKVFGKDCSTALEVIEFLRTIPVIDLIMTYKKIFKKDDIELKNRQVPTLDSKTINPVFTDAVPQMKKYKFDVPVIIGYNSHEGILLFLPPCTDTIKDFDNNFEEIVKRYLNINDPKKLPKIAKTIREYYFGNAPVMEEKIDEMVQFFSDILIVNEIQEVIDAQMQNDLKTYFYKFSYEPDYPSMKEKFNVKIKGTCHGDEMGCLFFAEKRVSKFVEGTRDRKSMELMTTMWTNFAKFGDPTPVVNELIKTKWLPIKEDKKNCLEINDNIILSENPDENKFKMWKSLAEAL